MRGSLTSLIRRLDDTALARACRDAELAVSRTARWLAKPRRSEHAIKLLAAQRRARRRLDAIHAEMRRREQTEGIPFDLVQFEQADELAPARRGAGGRAP